MIVPNTFPTLESGGPRIAVIAQSPGEREVDAGKPLVGPSGVLLNAVLGPAGIVRDQCFVGNVCLEENTPVLMADLSWKPIKEIVAGDWLLAFDELGKTRGDSLRKWRYSQVTATQKTRRECWFLESEFGNLTITPDHKVLSMPSNRCSSSRWSRVESLWVGRSNLALGFKKTDYDLAKSWYLAGLFDGEGTINSYKSKLGKGHITVSFSQNPNIVAQEGASAMSALGFRVGIDLVSNGKRASRIRVAGGSSESIRFMSAVPSYRLREKLRYYLRENPPVFRPKPSRLHRRNKKAGEFNVVDLTTTTGTFIANGFAVHNCQRRAPDNDFASFAWDGEEIREGVALLHADLQRFKPDIVLALGNEALHLMKTDGKVMPIRHKRKTSFSYKWPHAISSWRGSIFWSDFAGCKCVATYHPAAVLRDFSLQPYMKFDVRRVVVEARTRELTLPHHDIHILTNATEVIERLNTIQEAQRPISFDIEGRTGGMTCIGIATDAHEACVIPFETQACDSVWSLDDETRILEALRDLLEDINVPKIAQNSLFDAFVLAWTYGICVRGIVDDTMLKWHELYAELEKALDVQASILTRQPYWKDQRHSESDDVAYRYCGIDCCVTYECNERMEELLRGDAAAMGHYRFNVSLLPALLYMELRGIAFDAPEARRVRKRIEHEAYALQHRINMTATSGKPELAALMAVFEEATT